MNGKRGRPREVLDIRKDRKLTIRMTDRDMSMLQELCEKSGKSKSDTVRDMIYDAILCMYKN